MCRHARSSIRSDLLQTCAGAVAKLGIIASKETINISSRADNPQQSAAGRHTDVKNIPKLRSTGEQPTQAAGADKNIYSNYHHNVLMIAINICAPGCCRVAVMVCSGGCWSGRGAVKTMTKKLLLNFFGGVFCVSAVRSGFGSMLFHLMEYQTGRKSGRDAKPQASTQPPTGGRRGRGTAEIPPFLPMVQSDTNHRRGNARPTIGTGERNVF